MISRKKFYYTVKGSLDNKINKPILLQNIIKGKSMINDTNIQESNEPELCKKCDGIGSIWIYNKEETCINCNGKGLEPSSKVYRSLSI